MKIIAIGQHAFGPFEDEAAEQFVTEVQASRMDLPEVSVLEHRPDWSAQEAVSILGARAY